jgi:hypothetical protein
VDALSGWSIIFYCLFSIFLFYQKLHLKNFAGASEVFGLTLSISALAGLLTGVVYLIYYGWVASWWAPLAILVIGIVATPLGMVAERLVGAGTLSLVGFIGWPVCALLMFNTIPVSR